MSENHITTDDLLDRLDGLDDAIEDLMALSNQLRTDIEELPNTSKTDPVEEVMEVGDTLTLTIQEDGANSKFNDPMGRVDGIATFIQNGDGLALGDTVDVVVTKTGESHAEAVIPDD